MEHLFNQDSEIAQLIQQEEERQHSTIRLIPSENYVSKAVMEATGSVLTNKYSEGYSKKRYYEGQENIDAIEDIAIERAKSLFGSYGANVQPLSGAPANLGVLLGLLQPGDKIMGMALPHGGHLTHGWKVSATGIYYNAVQYELNPETKRLDYDMIRDMAKKEMPKLIIAGASAYPRFIDFEAFRSIADEVGAYFMTDMAHIAGLVAGGVHPSPVPYSDVVTTTTHKTLRGPRGGLILMAKGFVTKVNKGVFPGLQGGPHNHTTAAIAVALKEASSDSFKEYAKQVVSNAKVLADSLIEYGFDLVTGGTDNHLMLIDLTNKGITGKDLSSALNKVNIETNANTVPFDKRSPMDPSGVRLGTPAITSKGMKESEMKTIASFINRVSQSINDDEKLNKISEEVKEFSSKYDLVF
ncbi:serine hydroxymethyltransferase [bacterium]|nr:serine hydroxymethyltransferase [bacterium]